MSDTTTMGWWGWSWREEDEDWQPRPVEDLRLPLSVLHRPDEPTSCPTCSGQVRETVGMVCQTCRTHYAAEPTAVGDMRERVAHLIAEAIYEGEVSGAYPTADRVLAVVDPDGLRAEVERLTKGWQNEYDRHVVTVREAAALRAQIVTRDATEALAWDKSHDAVCVALTNGAHDAE